MDTTALGTPLQTTRPTLGVILRTPINRPINRPYQSPLDNGQKKRYHKVR